MVEAVKEVAAKNPGEGEVDDLIQLWSHVITLSDLRDARLQQALALVSYNNNISL